MRIAILGATGHVAKNCIVGLAGTNSLSLFARSVDRVVDFVRTKNLNEVVQSICPLDSFGTVDRYDVVLNCVGFGTPGKLRSGGVDVLFVTEFYDNLVLAYLKRNPETVYINFSSGAIYGTDNAEPVTECSEFRLNLGSISGADAYKISKLNAETKHRSLPGLSIFDLRLFSFFSRYIDMDASYLITDIMNAIRNGKEFVTDASELIRDYVHPRDLCALIGLCAGTKGINRPMDVYSAKPVEKSDVIKVFAERFGLKTRIVPGSVKLSPTGMKSCYASKSQDANTLVGYRPQYTSIDVLLLEAQAYFFEDT